MEKWQFLGIEFFDGTNCIFWQFARPQVSLDTLFNANGVFVTFMEIGLNLVTYAVAGKQFVYCQGLQTSSSCQKHWHAWFPLLFSLNSPSESLLHFAWMYRKMTFNASEHSKKAASCTGFIVVPVTCFSRYSRTLSLLCNEELFSYEDRFSFYQKKTM